MWHACKILVQTPEGKRPPERTKRKWEDNIRMDVRDWIHLAQDGASGGLL